MTITHFVNIFKSLNKNDMIAVLKWSKIRDRKKNIILCAVCCAIYIYIYSNAFMYSYTQHLQSRFEIVLLIALNSNGIERDRTNKIERASVYTYILTSTYILYIQKQKYGTWCIRVYAKSKACIKIRNLFTVIQFCGFKSVL